MGEAIQLRFCDRARLAEDAGDVTFVMATASR